MYMFEELRDKGMAVAQFQVRQVAPGRLEIDLVAPSSLPRITGFLERRITEAMPGVEVGFRSVSGVQRAPSGKMPLIINEIR
jgi:hypothetical protein